MTRFEQYLVSGAKGSVPHELLSDPEASEPLPFYVRPSDRQFANKQEFGEYLNTLLQQFDAASLSGDRGLWSALALFWFDQLCPANASGDRQPDKAYRYILSADYRHYYRHLVRSPWQLVRDHGQNARFLLLAASDGLTPLRRHGDILEQLGGTQAIIRSKPIVAAAATLYGDPVTGRPKRGITSKDRGGSVRRFARVLKQLELTFDPELLPLSDLSDILPQEFELWKGDGVRGTQRSSRAGQEERAIQP